MLPLSPCRQPSSMSLLSQQPDTLINQPPSYARTPIHQHHPQPNPNWRQQDSQPQRQLPQQSYSFASARQTAAQHPPGRKASVSSSGMLPTLPAIHPAFQPSIAPPPTTAQDMHHSRRNTAGSLPAAPLRQLATVGSRSMPTHTSTGSKNTTTQMPGSQLPGVQSAWDNCVGPGSHSNRPQPGRSGRQGTRTLL